jgi:transcription initiation factor IIE alpha subunit
MVMARLEGHDKKAVLKIDKARVIDYLGDKKKMNIYLCNNCKEPYTLEEVTHTYCPFCGNKYSVEIDVSVEDEE